MGRIPKGIWAALHFNVDFIVFGTGVEGKDGLCKARPKHNCQFSPSTLVECECIEKLFVEKINDLKNFHSFDRFSQEEINQLKEKTLLGNENFVCKFSQKRALEKTSLTTVTELKGTGKLLIDNNVELYIKKKKIIETNKLSLDFTLFQVVLIFLVVYVMLLLFSKSNRKIQS